MQVRSAVIPAAGMGTRFLPASKAVPKELLPIGDTPTLQLVIDEALGAGIEHIVVVSSRNKPAVEQYFAPAPELLAALEASGKTALAERGYKGQVYQTHGKMSDVKMADARFFGKLAQYASGDVAGVPPTGSGSLTSNSPSVASETRWDSLSTWKRSELMETGSPGR